MAIYKVTGSYEEFYEATIEADNSDIAQQIFYQNYGDLTTVDGNWVNIQIEDEYEDEEEANNNGEDVEYTMEDYNEDGVKTSV
jgi:uncharacterized protein YxeA